MTAVTAPANYRLYIGGNVSGQVAVGNNNIQIGRVEGGVVYVARPGETATPRARPTPVWQQPRRFRGFLDRRQEASTAATVLQSNLPVEFYGQSGIGKTALLRHLAYHLPVDRFSDGVVYVRVQGKTLDDILQNLFDAFYESEIPLKATMTQLRHALGDKKALILLDDVAVTRDDLEALLDVAPNCAFLLATEDRRLYGDGRAVALKGLPSEEALALLERELGRPLSEAERSGAQGLAAQLEGHPLQILRMASLVRDGELSLTQLDGYRLAGAGQVTAQRVEALPERERRVVLGLAAVGGLPVSELHVAALAGLPDASVALQALAERGLVQIQDQQVSLPGDVAAALQQEADLAVHRTWALATFTQLAETQAEALAADSSAIQHLLTWAVESGRWSDALRLVRAVEGAVALDGQWGAWKQLLQSGLRAAQATGNRSAQAWAWHQLGTRALCLEQTEVARTALVRALRLRQGLGEHAAAAITRHNLEILLGPPSQNGKSSKKEPPDNGSQLRADGW
ncbi:MAG TPA: ATP-binding protein, partial [Anaerolineae bacterium]